MAFVANEATETDKIEYPWGYLSYYYGMQEIPHTPER